MILRKVSVEVCDCKWETCVIASVEARGLLEGPGLPVVFCETGECNDGSGTSLVPLSFVARWPLMVRRVSLTLGSFRDSAAEGEVTPRLGGEFTSRALPLSLFLPYFPTKNACRGPARRKNARKQKACEIHTYEARANYAW
jgi:hypothetical protein